MKRKKKRDGAVKSLMKKKTGGTRGHPLLVVPIVTILGRKGSPPLAFLFLLLLPPLVVCRARETRGLGQIYLKKLHVTTPRP